MIKLYPQNCEEIEVKVTATELGVILANLGSEEQAEFFNALAIGFAEYSKGDKDGMQMLFVSDGLSSQAKDFVVKFAEYIGNKLT